MAVAYSRGERVRDGSIGRCSHVEETKNPWLTPTVNQKLQDLIRRDGAPGGTRTPALLVRSQTLYPPELRAHRSTTRTNINHFT